MPTSSSRMSSFFFMLRTISSQTTHHSIPGRKCLFKGSYLLRAITILLWKSWLYRLGRFAFQYSHSNGPASLDKNARGVTESMDALSAIAAFCREHGINFVTFFYRSKREPLGGLSFALFSEIQTIGQSYGFSVADVGSWWADVDMRS